MTLFIIFILITAVISIVYIYLYDRWYLPRSRSHDTSPNHHRPAMIFFTTNPSHTASRGGLHPAVLKSLPVFTFSDVTHKDHTIIDCAVCLSEFEEGESGRVLPGCKHAFHVECIDMWFHSHSTCPLCRSLVQPEHVTIITISPEPVSATEPGSSSGYGSSAMPLDHLGREREVIDLTGIVRLMSRDRTRALS